MLFLVIQSEMMSINRVFQYESSQWLIGKSMDDFAPIGPSIVTKDSIDSVQDLSIQTRLNGKVVQDDVQQRNAI